MGRVEIDEEKANRMRQAHPEWFNGNRVTRPYLNWTREMDDYINELYAESKPKSSFVTMFNMKFNTNKSYSSIAQRYHALSKNVAPTYSKVCEVKTEATEVVELPKEVSKSDVATMSFLLSADVADRLNDLRDNKFVNVDAFVSSVLSNAIDKVFG